jgi:hypothetical protein
MEMKTDPSFPLSIHFMHFMQRRYKNYKKITTTKETEILIAIFISPAARGMCIAIKDT